MLAKTPQRDSCWATVGTPGRSATVVGGGGALTVVSPIRIVAGRERRGRNRRGRNGWSHLVPTPAGTAGKRPACSQAERKRVCLFVASRPKKNSCVPPLEGLHGPLADCKGHKNTDARTNRERQCRVFFAGTATDSIRSHVTEPTDERKNVSRRVP